MVISEWYQPPAPPFFYFFIFLMHVLQRERIRTRGSAAAGWPSPLHASTPPLLLKIHTHNAHVRVRILGDTDADLVRVNLRQSLFHRPRVRSISWHGRNIHCFECVCRGARMRWRCLCCPLAHHCPPRGRSSCARAVCDNVAHSTEVAPSRPHGSCCPRGVTPEKRHAAVGPLEGDV